MKENKENIVSVDLKTEEPQILIGRDGQTLMDIQHLLKRILRKTRLVTVILRLIIHS